MTPPTWIKTAGARLLTTEQAAGVAGVTVMTIHAWVRSGHLRTIKPGRAMLLDRRDVERLAAKRRKAGG